MPKRRYLIEEPKEEGPLSGLLLILWHGAGGDVDQRHLAAVAKAAAGQGAISVRTRFHYRTRGKKAPDRMARLLEHAEESIEKLVEKFDHEGPVVLGGRSMGGRVASMLVSDGARCDGLLFLSYPLHPAGKKESLRDEHLYKVKCPMLFMSGDRDALCDLELLRPVLKKLGRKARLVEFAGSDHSLHKASDAQASEAALPWLQRIVR